MKHIADGKQVVVAFDFSPTAEAALGRAIDLAVGDPTVVLHVGVAVDAGHRVPALPTGDVDAQYTEKVHDILTEKLTAIFAARAPAHTVHFFAHVRIGKPAAELLMLAREVSAEMVVIGSHGWRGLDRLLFGSVSEQVVREALCPVLVVRSKTYPPARLEDVVKVDAPHRMHMGPRRYSYTTQQVLTRPKDFPIS